MVMFCPEESSALAANDKVMTLVCPAMFVDGVCDQSRTEKVGS
jgi:hypothetical protein